MRDPVYLDYNAKTPVAPEVFEAMLPWLRERCGNPSSTHRCGCGAPQRRRDGALRVSLGRINTRDQVERAAQTLVWAWRQLHV